MNCMASQIRGKQRRHLRALGQRLTATVHVGHDGVTDAVVAHANAVLELHELIKVRIGDNAPQDRHDIAEALAAKGILVAALDFRQPPEAGYPASICDINLAVRWLKRHAAEFNGTTAVGAFGNSSGGHQVVLSALRPRHASYSALPLPNHPEIDASLAYVIAGWPVIDPLYRFRYAKEINNQEHIKAHIDYWRTEEAMAEGSPQTIIEQDEQIDLPPLLMMLKANDRNHPLEMQERFIASYRKRGGAIEVHTFDGLPEHRMVPSPTQPETMRAIDTITIFIRRQTE